MLDLLLETARFARWADTLPSARSGEWECDYEHWPDYHAAVAAFIEARPIALWSSEETRAVLYAIARDNEIEHLAREVRCRHPEILIELARASIHEGEPDARWQLAEELGRAGPLSDVEAILLELARDDAEYVRRRALAALARLGSTSAEALALEAWDRPDPNQQWARMMALWCLHRIGSSHLEPKLVEAEHDGREYLAGYARKIRNGEIDS